MVVGLESHACPDDCRLRNTLRMSAKLPDLDTLRVPARWLYPGDADRPRWSHRDADD